MRGISLKLQEEERERRMDFVPEVSAIETDLIEVDKDTRDMLEFLDIKDLPGIQVAQVMVAFAPHFVDHSLTYSDLQSGY